VSAEVTSVRVHMRHIRQARLCAHGARTWWKHNGLSWSDFLSNGIDSEVLLKTGDPRAATVVKMAREEQDVE